jgi:hypothetical protein
MFFLMSVVTSVGLLLIVNWIARSNGRLGTAATISAFGGLFGFPCLMLPALLFSGFLMAVAGVVCKFLPAGPRKFRYCSIAAVVGSHLFLGVHSLLTIRDREHWREQYPTQSLEERLGYEGNPREPQAALGAAATGRLDTIGLRALPEVQGGDRLGAAATGRLDTIEGTLDSYEHQKRKYSLRWLHEDTVQDFIESPGFGVTRMMGPRKEDIEIVDAPPIPLPDPAHKTGESGPEDEELLPLESYSPGASEGLPREQELFSLHDGSVLDFVNPKGFGFVRDRAHVKGFQAHQFRALPELATPRETAQRWRVRRLELVSLLKQQEPAVYVSEHLPRMDELRGAPTRPLDAFEKRALAALRAGEDLKAESALDQIRMLGAVRAAHQCLECHRGERGKLLGAFSYRLQRLAPESPASGR